MFSGIIEACEPVLFLEKGDENFRFRVRRPSAFADIHVGDSICTNGVCLTVEEFSDAWMQFAIGAETIRVLQLVGDANYFKRPLNLERSLAFGSRIHGHFVSGHVDAVTRLVGRQSRGESLDLIFELPHSELRGFIWLKGSATIHGASLTVNEVTAQTFSVCLIPETMKRTNLALLEPGDEVCLEFDWLAKAFERQFEQYLKHRLESSVTIASQEL